MSLPTKKQLHKHKRGTRKALDTLDALEMDSETPDPEEKIIKSRKKKRKDTAEKKKSKKELEIILEGESNTIDLGDDASENLVGKDEKESVDDAIVDSEKVISKENVEFLFEKQSQIEPLGKVDAIILDKEEEPEPFVEPPKTEIKKEDKIEPENIKAKSTETEMDVALDVEESTEDTQKDKYLTFHLEPENYGISIKYVIEIIVLQSITEVPDTPEFVNGVINLRGKVIPVIDVRRRFRLDFREYDERTCIIVVDIDGIAVGMIVDTVNEVVDIPANQVDPAPRTHSGVESSYIQGMGKVGKEVKILLDVERVTHIEKKTDEND